MVELRSRNAETKQSPNSRSDSTTRKKGRPASRRISKQGDKNQEKEVGKVAVMGNSNSISRQLSRPLIKSTFLASPQIHTRSDGPAPDISLSTELPEWSQIKEGLAHAGKKENNTSQEDINREIAERSQSDSDSVASQEEFMTRNKSDAHLAHSAPDLTVQENRPVRTLQNSSERIHEDISGPNFATNDESEDSDTESSESENELTGLAKSVWDAFQNLHNNDDRNGNANILSNGNQLKETGHKEIIWRPQHNLPAPASLKDYEKPVSISEPNLNKQFMAAPRDKKTEKARLEASKERPWHDLPDQVMTDELKRDLRLLRLRGAMDTKRFYKKAEKGSFPKKFAIGTIIEGPGEFYSGRLSNKERKQSITDELLADHGLQDSRKRRYGKMQEENQRWSHKKYKGSGERLKKRAKRPKH